MKDIQRYALMLDLHEDQAGKWVRYQDHLDVLASEYGEDNILAAAANRVHDFLMSATAYPFSKKVAIAPRILFGLILNDLDAVAPWVSEEIDAANQALDEAHEKYKRESEEAPTVKYRKKPVTVEAVQATFESIQSGDLIDWLVGNQAIYKIVTTHADGIIMPDEWYIDLYTLEGTMTCDPGDWIIKGIKGELYPCKPDIFEATYDAVE